MSGVQMNNEFTAKPRVIQNKQKYRQNEIQTQQLSSRNVYNNLMYEKRIIRGNTYARVANKDNEEPSNGFMNSHSQEAQKIMNNQILDDYQKPSEQYRTEKNGYQFDQEGNVILNNKEHVSIETDPNVETITNKAPNYEKDTQTEFKIEKKVERHYMKEKVGEDIGTQIKDGEIFDFDYEVEPLLQALCGKSLEISKMEVIQEEELKAMKKEQERLRMLEEKEGEDRRKLEEEERERFQKMKNLKEEMSKKKVVQVEVHRLLVGRQLTKQLLARVGREAIIKREMENGFIDTFSYQLQGMFLDWSQQRVEHKYYQHKRVQNTIDQLAQQSYEGVLAGHKDNIDTMKKWQQKMTQESLEKTQREEEQARKEEEARLQRKEARRQARVIEQVKERILAKGEEKTKVMSQVVSEVDNYEAQGGFIGVVGGGIGLVAMLYQQVLKEALQPEEREEAVKTALLGLVDALVEEGGSLAVPVGHTLEDTLLSLGIVMSEVLTTEDTTLRAQAIPLFKAAINSKVLNVFKQTGQHQAQVIQWLVDAVVDYYFSEESGGKGVTFLPVKEENIIEKFQQQAYVVYKPVFPQEEEEDQEEDQVVETMSQKERRLANEFYDQDLEDKALTVHPKDEELEVLIIHQVATIILIKEIFSRLGGKYESLAYLNEQENIKPILISFEAFHLSEIKKLSIDTSVFCSINGY